MTSEPTNHLDVTEVASTIVEMLKEQNCFGESIGAAEQSCTFSINISGTRFRIVVTEINH